MNSRTELVISAYKAINEWATGRTGAEVITALAFIAFDQFKEGVTEEGVMTAFRVLYLDWKDGRSQ